MRWLAAVLVVGVGLGVWAWLGSRRPAPVPAVSVVTVGNREGGFEGLARPTTGAGSQLVGHVVDNAGIPLTGVDVSAQSQVDAVAAPASRASVPLESVTARTGPDGRYRLLGLAPGSYRVRVTGAGIFSAEVPAVVVPGADLSIIVARKVAIAGKVSVDGQPVAGAVVEVSGEAIGGSVEVSSGPDGRFAVSVLPEGEYDVTAHRNELASSNQHLVRLGAGPFADIDLRLQPAALVTGRIFEGEVGDAGRIVAVARGTGVGVVAALELRSVADDEPARYAQSSADGRFRIEGVRRGRWVVTAIAPGFVTPAPVEIDAGRGLVEIPVIAGGSIEGRVMDSNGKPIVGADLRALQPGSGREKGVTGLELSGDREASLLAHLGGRPLVAAAAWSAEVAARADPRFSPRGELGVLLGPIPLIPPVGARAARRGVLDPSELPPELAALRRPPPVAIPTALASQWQTDVEGRYRLRGLPPGRFTLIARAPGFVDGKRSGVQTSAGAIARNVDISLSVGSYLVGTVHNHRGDPVSAARLLAAVDSSAPVETRSNGDGSYRLGPLLGVVQLEVTAPRHAAVRRRFEVSVVAGSVARERREDFTLLAYDTVLRGVVDDAHGVPVSGARITVAQGQAQGRSAASAVDGTFTIDALPAGAVPVIVEHREFPSHRTTLDPASLARVALPFGGGLAGRVVDDAGTSMAGVRVVARGPGAQTAETVTARDGTWQMLALPPGSWQVTVTRSGYLPMTRSAAVASGDRRAQLTVRDIEFALERGALAAGTIRDRRGARLADARVIARRADGVESETRSDARGEFRLRDCAAGNLSIIAEYNGASTSMELFLRPGQEVVSLVLEIATP